MANTVTPGSHNGTAASSPYSIVHENTSGTLALGDNLSFMQSLPIRSCDLIYVDPPFMSERRRTTQRDANGFDDQFSGSIDDFLEFLRPRCEQMRRILSDHGSLCVHLDWRTVHYVRVMLDRVFGRENLLNEIIWSYRTGGVARRTFARKHDTLLLYAKCAGRHTFNAQRGGEYRTDGLLQDDKGRPFKRTRSGPVYFNPEGPTLTDVWEIPFLSTVSRERTGYPTQKPRILLERIIAACSNENDVVADFFCGSGTTLDAARRLNRRCLGCDVNPKAIRITSERLEMK